MSKSVRYRQLVAQINKLETHLLPSKPNPLGFYRSHYYSKTYAYRVLSHAEIESYIEDRVIEIADKAISRFQKDQKISKTSLALIAFCGKTLEKPPDSINVPNQNLLYYKTKISTSYTVFRAVVANNNGIREKNLLGLLLPIGINIDDVDRNLILKLDTFGKSRGTVAHSSRKSLAQKPNPQDELNTVKGIITDLLGLDELINSLRKSI